MHIREEHNLTICRQTKGRIPDLPFVRVKEAILGKKYELSLIFPTQADSITLHQTWKQKNNPVNVLAFPLDKNEGEIIITLEKARREARQYEHSYHEQVLYLFIHACLHLKGMDHGDRMDTHEQIMMKKFRHLLS